jgi:hypothetical protein
MYIINIAQSLVESFGAVGGPAGALGQRKYQRRFSEHVGGP